MSEPVAAAAAKPELFLYIAIAVAGLAIGVGGIWLSLIAAIAFGRWMDA